MGAWGKGGERVQAQPAKSSESWAHPYQLVGYMAVMYVILDRFYALYSSEFSKMNRFY